MTTQLVHDSEYLPRICAMLRQIEEQEMDAIRQAASAAYRSIRGGGLLHAFSTGHSHMIVEELFLPQRGPCTGQPNFKRGSDAAQRGHHQHAA